MNREILDRSERLRRKLILDTQRYLNNPRSKPWQREIRPSSNGRGWGWQESTAA
jgi:hypothetical protein